MWQLFWFLEKMQDSNVLNTFFLFTSINDQEIFYLSLGFFSLNHLNNVAHFAKIVYEIDLKSKC